MSEQEKPASRPGACVAWEDQVREMPVQGDEELVRRVWEEVDSLPYTFIWQCLLSF